MARIQEAGSDGTRGVPRKPLSPLALRFCKWVDDNLNSSGKSAVGLAKHLGLPPGEIFHIRNGRREIRVAQVPKISEYFGILPPVGLLGLADCVATQIPYAGSIELNVWRKIAPTTPSEGETMAYVAGDDFPGLSRRWFHMLDDSADEVVPAGARVVCVPYWKARENLTNGDLVVVRRIPTPNAPDLWQVALWRVSINGRKAYLSTPTKVPELVEQVEITTEKPIRAIKTKVEIEILGLAVEFHKSLISR